MIKPLILASALISPLAMASDVTPAKQMVKAAKAATQQVDLEKFESILAQQDTVVIDVRTEQEFNDGHIEGAIWLPRGKLEFKIADLVQSADTPIALYCRSGSRSALSNQTLVTMGYRSVVDLDGGFKAWKASNRAVIK